MTIKHITLAASAILLGGLAGCRGDREDAPPRQFFPDMDDQPKWREQSKSGFYADGRTMRMPVEGTVAFGRNAWRSEAPAEADGLGPVGASVPNPWHIEAAWANTWTTEQEELLGADTLVATGVNPDGTYAENIPMPVTRQMLELGRTKFDINCSACHGYDGDGKGTVGQQWSIPVPNYFDPKYTDRTQETGRDGYMFHIIRNGVRTMPAYGHTLGPSDAWAVVAYIRVLQETRQGTLADVPDQQKARVQELMRSQLAVPTGDPAASPATVPNNTPVPTVPSADPQPAGSQPGSSDPVDPAEGGPK